MHSNTEPKLHDLLYLKEHLTCNRYLADIRTGFVFKKLKKGNMFGLEQGLSHQLLVFLEGSRTIDYGCFLGKKFSAGEMVLIHRRSSYVGQVTEDMKIVVMSFDCLIGECDKLVFESYANYRSSIKYDFRATPIRYPLTDFFHLLIYYLQNGINCAHLHEIKHKELFLCLRWFYTKEEITYLFYELIGKSMDFRQFIYDNYKKVSSIAELIELSNVSKPVFYRRFKKEFGASAYQWILKHRREEIIRMVVNPQICIDDLYEKFGYASKESFHNFCRKEFGCTPKQLMNRYRSIASQHADPGTSSYRH